MYLKDRRIKLEIALARGKKMHDKRHDLKARDARREMDRQR
jgi:SsrA-binding protein